MHPRVLAFLLLLTLIASPTNVCAGFGPQSHPKTVHEEIDTKTAIPLINLGSIASSSSIRTSHNVTNATTSATQMHNANTINQVATENKLPLAPADDLMQSGALQRAFYVLLGGTVLLVLFLGLRIYRLLTGSHRPNVMVRKYGVLARRRDVEMLPLPLDEDDEDDTVFEVNNQIENHS